MPTAADQPPRPSPRTPWWFPLAQHPYSPIALLFLVLALTIIWQIFSPLTLVEDEAHYWEWSRHLDWSYYSKGPGIALLIRASTSVLGNSEFAIRIPAAISIFLAALACTRMARLLSSDNTLRFVTAVLFLGVPGFVFSSMLMTIDAPYLACWGWASYFSMRALLRARKTDWILVGLLLAVGFIMKYTILLLIPGILLAAFVSRKQRPRLPRVWMSAGLALVALGLVPVLIWNAQHDWATIRHLMGHLAMRGGDTQQTLAEPEPHTFLWTLEYLLLLPAIGGAAYLLGLMGSFKIRKRASSQQRTPAAILLALALPVLVLYLLVSLRTQTEGNWPMSAFLTLTPIAAWTVLDGLARRDHLIRFLWGAACVTAVLAFAFFPLADFLSTRRLIGPMIPIERISGMREHAQAVQQQLDILQSQTQREPFVICDHYGRASLLAYYLQDHPIVYCNSSLVGGRKTQYDLWESTDLRNPETLAPLQGRPAVLFSNKNKQRMWSFAFDDVQDIGQLDREPKERQTSYTGTNFSNFDAWTPPPQDPAP